MNGNEATAEGNMSTKSKSRHVLGWSVVGVLLILLAVKTFWIGYYRIPQNGMYPNLPAGSILFASKRAYRDSASVKRGDVILFMREENGRDYQYIWRVVALPGETVEAAGESLIINGKEVSRERLRVADGKVIFREQNGDVAYEVAFDQSPRSLPPDVAITLPEDHFFMMGDNRFGAVDSRFFGPVPFGSIFGRKL